MTIQSVMGPSQMIENAQAAVVGAVFSVQSANRVFQAILTGAPDTTAEVAIDVCQDGVHFQPLATINLTVGAGKAYATDGFSSAAPWRYVRASVVAVSAGASVDVFVGV